MTIAAGNFSELLWPGIAEIWTETYGRYKPLYEQVFEKRKADKRFEKVQGITGLPLAAVKDEGAAIPYVDPYQGYQREFVMTTYALGAIVTREMYDDDQYGVINDLPKHLAESMRQTEETVAWNHFNRAFNATYTGADGATLLNTSHTLVGGGTYSNRLATDSDLTQTAVETAVQNLMDSVDEQNLKIRVMPKCLVVPTALNFTARKILETANAVGSANNDVNPIPGLFSDLVVSPWLTDTDAWFIVTDVPLGLIWWTRREAEVARDNVFDTQDMKFITTKRWSSGWYNSRALYGTPGA